MTEPNYPVDSCTVCGRSGVWVPSARMVWHESFYDACELPPLDNARTRTVLVPVEVPV